MSNVLRSYIAKALTARARGVGSVSRRNFSSYFAPSSGKQTISLADEFNRQMMTDIMFAGFAFVGSLGYFVKEYVPIYNAKQEYVKMVAQVIKQIKQQQAIKEQAKASAGSPEELKNKKTNEEDPVVLSQQLADARAYIATQATIIQQNVEKMTCLDAYFDYLAEKDPDFAAKFRPRTDFARTAHRNAQANTSTVQTLRRIRNSLRHRRFCE